MLQTLFALLQNCAHAAVVVALLWVAKKIADRLTSFNDDAQIEDASNFAVALRRAGLYLGVAIAVTGALSGTSQGFLLDLQALALDGLATIVLMFAAYWITDKVILSGIDDDQELLSGNTAVGIVSCANYVATGLILHGAFSGEGGGVLSALVFFVLGEILLMFGYLYYGAVIRVDLTKEISSGNTSAALALASFIVPMGLILKASIAGPFVSWSSDLGAFGVSAIFGVFLLGALAKVVDWLFLPNTDFHTEIVRDKNSAALGLTVGTMIALALVISSVI